MLPEGVVAWLLASPDPWVVYRTRLDLLRQAESAPEVRTAREQMLAHPAVQSLMVELAAWPGSTLTNHNATGHLHHKLAFVTDLGLRAGDPGMDQILLSVRSRRDEQGIYLVRENIPTHFGGSGVDQDLWMLCDAPLLVYALAQAGLDAETDVRQACQALTALARPNGWPCAASKSIGKFRGPGNKADPCPYANLIMLKLLALDPVWQSTPEAQAGAEAALELWAERRTRHPYLFHMGTDFSKLKAPLAWYNLLHVVDVLSRYPALRSDPRLREMGALLRAKADPQGTFTPESIWTTWKSWDFGQKKVPSAWLTLLAWRALERLEA